MESKLTNRIETERFVDQLKKGVLGKKNSIVPIYQSTTQIPFLTYSSFNSFTPHFRL